jgi:phosphoglycerate dehydrogenase-like enzyme
MPVNQLSRGCLIVSRQQRNRLYRHAVCREQRHAVLDVCAGELAGQPPRPELTRLPQILLTPHISASGEANMAQPFRELFADNLRRCLDGQPLLNEVDRSRGY